VFICGWLYGSFSVMADFFKNRPKMAENRSFSLKTCPKWTNFARFQPKIAQNARFRPPVLVKFFSIFWACQPLPSSAIFIPER
jgi:hypothetical protein